MALLAEDVLLLLLDRDTGRLAGAARVRPLLGGALLSELALTGRAVLVEDERVLRSAKVRTAGTPPAPSLLAEAWSTVAERPRTPQDLVGRLGQGVRDPLAGELVARGVLRAERGGWPGPWARPRWPAASAVVDDGVRQRVAAVLLLGQQPDPRTRALVALLSAASLAHRVVDTQRLPAREVRRRAKALADGDWAAHGVRDALAAASAGA